MTPFTRRRAESVAALGEERLIAAIRGWLGKACPGGAAGIGDDCAVLPGRGRELRLLTVDPVIFGRHFDARIGPAAAGRKLMNRNLSDIAAMGGIPAVAVVGLILSPDVRTAWLREFYRGLAQAAIKARAKIVGGDIAQAPATAGSFFSAHLTLLGSFAGKRVLTRAGARAGDALYVTGVLGGSLTSGHHHAFSPRLAEGQWLAGRKEVVAMMDISDGLAKDLRQLTPKGCVPALCPGALPRRKGASVEAALSDGEDYELVFAVEAAASPLTLPARAQRAPHPVEATRPSRPLQFERQFARRFPTTPLTRIGSFIRGKRLPAGAVPLDRLHGYEHLR